MRSLPLLLLGAVSLTAQIPVTISVDAEHALGPCRPIFGFFGYDEPNYTYTSNGRKLVGELGALSGPPVFIRTHFLLATGDGTPAVEVGIDERLYGGRLGEARLRLDDYGSHLRHLSTGGREAVRRDRVHAASALDTSGPLPAGVDSRRQEYAIQHRLDLPAGQLQEVGGAGVSMGAARRRQVRARRGGGLVLGGVERAGHRVLARHAGGV